MANFGEVTPTPQTFYLDGLSNGFTASQALIDSGNTTVITADATCEMELELSIAQYMFQFQSDALDVNDVAGSDLNYLFQDPTMAVGLTPAYDIANVHNPGNAFISVNPQLAVADPAELGLGGKLVDLKNQMKHDWVRYLALKLYGTIHGVDIFSNEEAVRDSIKTGAETALTARFAAIEAYQTANGASVEGKTALSKDKVDPAVTQASGDLGNPEMAPAKLILDQILASDPSRVQESVLNQTGFQPVPLKVDDIIAFKVTVSPHANQLDTLAYTPGESLSSVVPNWSYLVKMKIIA